MTLQTGLSKTPAELLSYIFDNLTLTELDVLEKACFYHPVRSFVGPYIRRRAKQSCSNPLLELAQIKRAGDIGYLAFRSSFDVNVIDEFGRTPLHIAAESGHIPVMQALFLFSSISVNQRDCAGRSALVLASQNGHADAADILLHSGAEVDLPTCRGETALSWAARNGHRSLAHLLISKCADIVRKDAEGWTALDWAVIKGQGGTLELLLFHHHHFQGSLDKQNKVLLLAAESGNDLAIRMILVAGADVNCKDDQESTPLHLAVSFGHQSTVALLLDWGANPNSKDMYGNTPLHWAILFPHITTLLIKENANVNAQNRSGKTSLMCSALAKQEEAAMILLTLGRANANIRDDNGCTALHGAAARGTESVVLHLLGNGANASATDVDGWTPIDTAAVHGHMAVLAILQREMEGPSAQCLAFRLLHNEPARCILQEMSQRKAIGSGGVTGLRSAVNSKHTHRLLDMLEAGADIDELDPVGGATALTLASWFNDMDTVKLLLENGATIDTTDSNGRTALHTAVEGGYCDLVALLANKGANTEANYCGWTPLLLAAKRLWDDEVGPWMVEHLSMSVVGANLHAKDYYGRGVLHWCAVYGSKDTMTHLVCVDSTLAAGKDHYAQSILHYAIAAGRVDMAQVLLQQDVGLDNRSRDGLTPAHIAAYTGQLNILALLVNACEGNRERGRRSEDTAPPGTELQLNATDADGHTALAIALLTGNLQIAQLLRRLPGGKHGDFQYRDSVTYSSINAWRPPPLMLPAEQESMELSQASENACPQKPLFSTTVREWLKYQRRNLEASETAVS